MNTDRTQRSEKSEKSYAFLVAFSNPSHANNREKWEKDMEQHLAFIIDTIAKLPDLFGPYIYFGNYKK
jgi:hypothetical protein